MKKLILIMLGLVFLSGCYYNTKQHKVEIQPVKENEMDRKMYIASYPAELRGTYYSGNKSCAEPTPDVATSEYVKYLRKLQEAGITSENSGERNTSVKELAGRDPTVLITRELLFRICEMGLNYPDNTNGATLTVTGAERAEKLYKEVLKVLVALAKGKEANAANAETGKVNAQTKAANAETGKVNAQTKATNAETGKVNAQTKATNAETWKAVYSIIQTRLKDSELKKEEKDELMQKLPVFNMDTQGLFPSIPSQ